MGLFQFVIIAVMVVLNGLFAAYELAVASVKPTRLKELADRHRFGAASALRMKGRMEASLAVVQLGITLVGAIAAATGGATVVDEMVPRLMQSTGMSEWPAKALALVIFVVPLSAVTIVAGELVPKVFAIRNPELVCRMMSPAMEVFSGMVFPAVWCFERVTRLLVDSVNRFTPRHAIEEQAQGGLNELRAQANLLRASRVIGAHQEKIILQASKLSQMPVSHIMVDAEDLVMLDTQATLAENIVTAHLDLHTRFPVTEVRGDPQKIIGYVNIKELIFLAKTHPANPVLGEILRPLISFPADMKVNEALRTMVSAHVHLGLVRDSSGVILGMITQEDIFEELVGEIEDEFDRLPRHVTAAGKAWIVGGGVTVGSLRQTLGNPQLAPDQPDGRSLADWVAATTDRHLRGGDVLELGPVQVQVRKTRRQKIAEAQIAPRA